MLPYGLNASAIWHGQSGSLADLTLSMVRRGSSQAVLDSGDYLYIGYERRFDLLLFWLTSTVSQTQVTWECSTGVDDWAEFIPIQEREWLFNRAFGYVQFDLQGPGIERWVLASLTGGLDARERYWVRVSVTVGPVNLEALTIRPYASVAAPEDVGHQLQLRDQFTADTTPSFETVEDYLRDAEDDTYRLTGHYYRPTVVEDELIDFKPYGMTLRHRPVLDMLDISVWNGNDWETKVEGRNGDWHYDSYTGQVFISTIFLDVVPPILRRGYSERRQQGAFKKGVRARYVHGHDSRLDAFGTTVKRTVIKQAAIDVVTSRDFANLIPTNLDRMSLAEKAKVWQEEVEEFRSRYARLSMF